MKWQRIAQAAVLLGASALIGGCFGIEFSPDGKWIAFVWPDTEKIGIMPAQGGTVRWLSSIKEGVWPHWSPDGKHLLVALDKKSAVVNVDQDRASDLNVSDGYGVWGPKGDQFAIVNADSVNWFQLGAKDPSYKLALKGGVTPWMPTMAWVPDNDAILFLGSAGKDEKRAGDVYLAEQGELTKLTTMGNAIGMALSPGGKSVRWCTSVPSGRSLLFSVYEMDLHLRTAQRLRVIELAPSEAGLGPKATQKANFAIFSPDAESLVVATEQESQSVKDSVLTYLGSNGAIKILDRSRSVTGFVLPAFHPNGRSVALQKVMDKNSIEWIDLDTAARKTLYK